MKVYFAGSIRGGREEQSHYASILRLLREHAEVLTEHVADAELSSRGEDDRDDRFIHDRDMQWLTESDAIVAEVTAPSLGVGYEVGQSVAMGKPVLALFRESSGRLLSAMIGGSPQVRLVRYRTVEELREPLRSFFEMLL